MSFQSGRSSAGRPRHKRGGAPHRRGGRKGPAKKYIHPSKFINKAVAKAEEVPYEPTHTFADFPFGSELAFNIKKKATKPQVQSRIKRFRILLPEKM